MLAPKPSTPKVGSRFWGKVQAKIQGLKAWTEHDHSTSWDDGGVSEQLAQEITSDLSGRIKEVIADQTKEAVSEYARDAQFALGARDGQVMVGLNLASQGARIIVQVPLNELINAAVTDAYQQIAHPEAQAFVSALMKLAGDLGQLRNQMARPQPAPEAQPISTSPAGSRATRPALKRRPAVMADEVGA